jgi:hypothetical protein
VLQEYYKGVTRVLQGSYNSITRVLQGSNKGVTRVLQRCYKNIQVKAEGNTTSLYVCLCECYNGVVIVLHWWDKGVAAV